MTVNSTTNRMEYAGDGASTVFAVGFYFLTDADLKVYLRDANDNETLLTITTHYSVADAGNPAGGSVTMLTAPAVGEKLVIVRDPALTQLTDYQANDAFPAETHERALDNATMQVQRLSERIDRSVVLEETATSGSGSYDFGGNSISNLGAPIDSDDASTKAYVDEILALVNAAAGDEAFSFVPPSGVTGTANAIILTAGSIPSSPTDGYKIRFIPEADSTGAVTLQLKDGTDDWGVIALVDRELAAMTGDELKNKVPAEAVYSEAELKWVFNHGGAGGGSVVVVRDSFTGDGVDTTFTMSVTPAADDEISVYIDGVYQNETEWSFAGTTLTLTEAPANGAKGEIVIHNQAGSPVVPGDGSVTTAKLANSAATTAKIADGAATVAKLGNDVPLKKEWKSGNVAIGYDVTTTVAHTLGVAPGGIQIKLVCDTIDLNYAVGDVIYASLETAGVSTSNVQALQVVADENDITILFSASGSGVQILDKSSRLIGTMTRANWHMEITAWAK